jgi:hypothetical protein
LADVFREINAYDGREDELCLFVPNALSCLWNALTAAVSVDLGMKCVETINKWVKDIVNHKNSCFMK